MSESDISELLGSGIVLVIVLGMVAIGLAIAVFFILNLYKTLNACAEENQALSPALVWLLFIPLFNWFWTIWVVIKIKESLLAEYTARGWHSEKENYGYTVGLIWAIGSIVSIIPVIGILASLASLVCWIMYWVQTNQYKNKLIA